MGSKGNSVSTTSNQQYTPNAPVGAAGSQAITTAQQLAQSPFNMPTAPVAGFTPFQQQAFGATQNQLGMAQPYLQAGAGYLGQSAAPITGQDVSQYYNPMASNVFAQMGNIFGQQQRNTTGQLTQAAGGVGADRIAVGQAELANQQGLAAGQTAAGLYQQALQAAQQNKQMQAGAGYGLSQLGPAAQAAQLQSIGALGAAGGQQQQLAQAQQNAQYQNQLAGIAWPYQNNQYLASITGGLAPALGGQTQGQSTTTYPTPSPFSQMLGLGTAGIGAAGQAGLFNGGLGSFGKGAGVAGDPMAAAFLLNQGGRVMADGGAVSDYGKLADKAYRKDLGSMIPAAEAGNPYAMEVANTIGGSLPLYADGGDTDSPPPVPGLSVPKIGSGAPLPFHSLAMGQGHSGLLTGGVNLSHQWPTMPGSQQSGSQDVNAAIKMAQALGNQYGYASGGEVNPYDFGRGFAGGGEADPYGVGNPALYGDYPAQPHLGFGDIASARGSYDPSGTDLQGNPAAPIADYVRSRWDDSTPTFTPPAQETAVATTGASGSSGVDETGMRLAAPMGENLQTPLPRRDPRDALPETPESAGGRYSVADVSCAILRQESGNNPNICTSSKGAIGIGQIIPDTFRQYAQPGEDINNPTDNLAVHKRMMADYYKRYNGDVARMAVAYFSGPGNVSPPGSPTPWIHNRSDGNKSVAGYVNDVVGRLENRENGIPSSPLNADMTPERYVNRTNVPYPDATQRDWGQNATRSPWMSLIKAGAVMASTPGPIGSVIGKGIQAGVGELEGQRTALKGEEQINQKAQSLYQQAMEHLDRYQRKTPHELATEQHSAAALALSNERMRLMEQRFQTLPAGTLNRIGDAVRKEAIDPLSPIYKADENAIQAEIEKRAAALSNTRLGQPAAPGTESTETLPPQAASSLKEGAITTFGNGQKWTLRNGKPVRVQ